MKKKKECEDLFHYRELEKKRVGIKEVGNGKESPGIGREFWKKTCGRWKWHGGWQRKELAYIFVSVHLLRDRYSLLRKLLSPSISTIVDPAPRPQPIESDSEHSRHLPTNSCYRFLPFEPALVFRPRNLQQVLQPSSRARSLALPYKLS